MKITKHYTSYGIDEDVIQDDDGNDYQVLEIRVYHSAYRTRNYIRIVLDKFGLMGRESKIDLYRWESQSQWAGGEDGKPIEDHSLIEHAEEIRRAIMEGEPR